MISAENGSWDGGLTTQESVKYGRPITQEKKAVQSEKRSPVKTAESKKHFRHYIKAGKVKQIVFASREDAEERLAEMKEGVK